MNTGLLEARGGRKFDYSSTITVYSGRAVPVGVAGQVHHELGLHPKFLYQPPLPEIVEGMESGTYVVALNGTLQASANVRPVRGTDRREIGGVVKARKTEKGVAQAVVKEAVLLARGMGAQIVEARVVLSNDNALYFFRELDAQEREYTEISDNTEREVIVFNVTHIADE